jgi:hypothetical protein
MWRAAQWRTGRATERRNPAGRESSASVSVSAQPHCEELVDPAHGDPRQAASTIAASTAVHSTSTTNSFFLSAVSLVPLSTPCLLDVMSNVPEDANEQCVGPESEQAGKVSSCAGCPNQAACASGANRGPDPAVSEVEERMSDIRHKLLVLSGKGGVGKVSHACCCTIARRYAATSAATSVPH